MGLSTKQLHFTDEKRRIDDGQQKVDLGPCPRSHTARLKEEFNASVSGGEKYPTFEAEYEDNIRGFMADIDRKIAANKRRIDQTPEETAKFTNLMRDIADVEAALNSAWPRSSG
ncbi:hypothetical protein L7F22_014447 [Adiantum nelumboides]|nr:hypothetical protein [Adiantum nelumboides]